MDGTQASEPIPLVEVAEESSNKRRALTSSASADWGTPEIVQRFAASVLRPASVTGNAIDLDGQSSDYWQRQWPDDCRPAHYFDGEATAGVRRDFFDGSTWDDAISLITIEAHAVQATGLDLPITAFCNPAGDTSGECVQRSWEMMSEQWRSTRAASIFWVGFSLEQLASLQGKSDLDPLDRESACTIIPSRRARYMTRPTSAIAVLKTWLENHSPNNPHRSRKLADVAMLEQWIANHGDKPVTGDAPTHASYFTILWSRRAKVRAKQQSAMRRFLTEQAKIPRALFERCAIVGKID